MKYLRWYMSLHPSYRNKNFDAILFLATTLLLGVLGFSGDGGSTLPGSNGKAMCTEQRFSATRQLRQSFSYTAYRATINVAHTTLIYPKGMPRTIRDISRSSLCRPDYTSGLADMLFKNLINCLARNLPDPSSSRG